MERPKRSCQYEVKNLPIKRSRKPRTTEEMVAAAWKLLSNSAYDSRWMTFCYGAFEANVRRSSTLEMNLRILEEKGNEIASSVVSQLIGLMETVQSYSTCLVRVVNYTQTVFKSLETVVFPESWVCLHSCRAVVFQRGGLDIQLEIRLVDMREDPPKLNDVLHGYVSLPQNNATVLDLKERIDELKSNGAKFLYEGQMPLDPTFQIMELRPYNFLSATTFIKGSTEWMSLVKDAGLRCQERCVCHTSHTSGTLRFVAYVDDE